MNRDIDYRNLSDDSYRVDVNKQNPPIKEGNLVGNGKYKVLKVEDNQDNGMQAMAVAPVINGKVDTSQIIIAYAGTNASDGNNLETDIKSVILGSNLSQETVLYGSSVISVPVPSQIDTALAFAEKVKAQYPQSKIETTGHSLGGFLATIVSIKNKWEMTAFNAPSAHKFLTYSERQWAIANNHLLINYRNSEDWIGNYGDDPLGIERKIFPYSDMGFFDVLTAHGLNTWKFDDQGNLIDKFGNVVDLKNYHKSIDINEDGEVDLIVGNFNIGPKNLLSSDLLTITDSKTIKINPELLNILSSNLQLRISEDIERMTKICQLCIEKNQKINKDFEPRKQEVSESIKKVFESAGFPSLIYDLNNSVDDIIQQKSLLERGMAYSELRNPFLNHQTPIANGAILNTMIYNTQLATLRHACEPLVTQISQEKTHTIFSLFTGEQTMLGSWQIIESATKHLLQKSNEIFEGEGFVLERKMLLVNR